MSPSVYEKRHNGYVMMPAEEYDDLLSCVKLEQTAAQALISRADLWRAVALGEAVAVIACCLVMLLS